MAWYYVTYRCGHEGRIQIYGKVANRQAIADKEEGKLCPVCYKEWLEQKREQENNTAKKWAEDKGLVELKGTEKQIKWAESIRAKTIEKLELIADNLEKQNKEYTVAARAGKYDLEKINKWLEVLAEKDSAGWWIDNRGLATDGLAMIGIELNMLLK